MTSIILGAVVLMSLYTLCSCVYCIWFHPLARYPGPLLARLSRLWARVGNLHGRKSERIHAAHLRYGAVVRIGPNELSFSDPHAVRDIYTSDLLVKEEIFYGAKTIYHENHLMSLRDPLAHKRRRKLLQRGFSQASMLEFEPEMTGKIQCMLDHWSRLCQNSAIDVYGWSHWLAFDIVYHLLFDEDPGSVKAGKPPSLMPYIRAWRPTFMYKEFIPQLSHWGIYVPGTIGGHFRKVRDWKHMAVNIIRDCRQRDHTTPFLRPVIQGEKDEYLGRPLTDGEIAEESMAGMFGGSGTTANTLIYLLWACAGNPAIQQKLQAELDEAFSDQHVPEFISGSSLPYLQAVINETLRLYPTIIATLPRTAKMAVTIAGVEVPAGTTVGTQNLTIHRDPHAFPEPERFIPERWLDDNLDQQRREAWTPFSIGPRRCIAMGLAQMELSKIVSAFFLRFTAEIDPSMTPEDMRMYDNFSASPAGGKLLLRLHKR